MSACSRVRAGTSASGIAGAWLISWQGAFTVEVKGGELQVVWVMKQDHIGDAFFDLDAAAFLLTQLERAVPQEEQQEREQHAAGQHQLPPCVATCHHQSWEDRAY